MRLLLFQTYSSPMYPGNYSLDSDCRWRVRVPAGLVVQMNFTGKKRQKLKMVKQLKIKCAIT